MHVRKKNVKNYDTWYVIIRLELDEISPITQKHQFFPQNSVIKSSSRSRRNLVGDGTGDTRRRSTSVLLPNSLPIPKHGHKQYSILESSVTRKIVFTAMQRSILRFSFRKFQHRICDARAKLFRAWPFHFSFSEEFQSGFYILGLIFGHISRIIKKKRNDTSRLVHGQHRVKKTNIQLRKIGRSMADLLDRQVLGWCYKDYPGLGNQSVFYPYSSVGKPVTFDVVQVTGSNLTSNVSHT